MSDSAVYSKEGSPCIYLSVNGRTYFYDPNEKPLGSGAMGTVYLGKDSLTGEKIAIKRVKDRFSNTKQVRERAKLEASLAFKHPNLVEMIGYCEMASDNGPIFILSKYVSGTDIKTYTQMALKDDKDRIAKISQLIYSVTDALSYIHSKGFLHRDIKPSNIMVETNGNVRLMDFGIARMNGGNKFSTVGFIGTPQYSAPEQILRGTEEEKRLSPSTDLYELGITLYELLTGSNPYKSDTEAETLARQIKMRLPDNRNIPWRLLKVMRKATEKDPTMRYQSADEMKVSLRDALKQGACFVDMIRKYVPFIKL